MASTLQFVDNVNIQGTVFQRYVSAFMVVPIREISKYFDKEAIASTGRSLLERFAIFFVFDLGLEDTRYIPSPIVQL